MYKSVDVRKMAAFLEGEFGAAQGADAVRTTLFDLPIFDADLVASRRQSRMRSSWR